MATDTLCRLIQSSFNSNLKDKATAKVARHGELNMIESFEFLKSTASSETCSFPWAGEIDFFKRNKKVKFKSGLNILFGGNGSGKSTLLQMIGMSLAAVQGGRSCVTSTWLSEVFVGLGTQKPAIPGKLMHDGQPIMYFDARAKEGLLGGGFDDDFFDMGLENSLRRGSTGQLGLTRLDRMLSVLREEQETQSEKSKQTAKKKSGTPVSVKQLSRDQERTTRKNKNIGFPESIEFKVSRNVNSYWEPRLKVVDEMLAAKIEKGPRTLLFDEPESGFSFDWQDRLWRGVFERVDSSKFQVIIATHSPFALSIPGANYIEMEPGYIEQSTNALKELIKRI